MNKVASVINIYTTKNINVKFGADQWITTLRLRQDGRHFADNIFKRIFLNENIWISIAISLKFVSKRTTDNKASIGSDNGLVPNRQQDIIWTNDGLVYRCIYTSHGLTELMQDCNSIVNALKITQSSVQFIPRNMHTVLLCFALLWLCNRS